MNPRSAQSQPSRANSETSPAHPPHRAVSLPRALSKLGLCSRTQAFAYIDVGRVRVNGKVARDSSRRVFLDFDRIMVDGKIVKEPREPIVVALHKPAGYVTTRSDPQGRPTIYDLLPKFDRFIFPVGRLDRDTTGLLILTDDHRLGEALTNPASHVPKAYEVVLNREADASQLKALREGMDIGKGEVTRPASVEILGAGAPSSLVRVVIEEGKNRQVRRMFSAVGLSVMKLSRLSIGGFQLGGIPSGKFRLLSPVDRYRLLNVALGK